MSTEIGNTALPAYTRTAGTSTDVPATEHPPPSYEPPTSFRIGKKTLNAPLVRVDQLKTHLRLLRALHQLRVTVEEGRDPRFPKEVAGFEGEQRWAWFVSLAVERFERWARTVQDRLPSEWVREEIPPIDVLMVWHAYLLNPGWYSEDCTRLPELAQLSHLNDRFLFAVTAIDDFPVFEPTHERAKAWATNTYTAFHPLDAYSELTHRAVTCPLCGTTTVAPFIAEGGKGYAQQNFSVPCASPKCTFEITKERLGIHKLLRNLVRTVPDMSIAGTVYTPLDCNDTSRAKVAKTTLLGAWQLRKIAKIKTTTDEVATRAIIVRAAEKVEWSAAELRKRIGPKLRSHSVSLGRSTGRILSAYTDDRPFSIDLVGAVLRQGSFIRKMHDMGWTDPACFESAEDAVVLQHCVARYHAFLDLMAASPGSFYVPTLDIDLAWHTHQLMAKNYQSDCSNYVKRHIDHDDKIEEGRLSNAFDLTCRAWKNQFDVPYTYCGCPLPDETIGQRMSRLKVHILGISASTTGGLALPAHARADLLAGTHPSDHNAVYVGTQTAHARTERERARRAEKARKRRARDLQLVHQGKMSEAAYRLGHNHDQAFLVPVPFYGYTIGPVGGCIAAGGSVVGGDGGAASCAMGVAGCGSSGGCGSGAACGGGGGGWGGGGGCGGGGSSGGGGGGGGGGGCGGS